MLSRPNKWPESLPALPLQLLMWPHLILVLYTVATVGGQATNDANSAKPRADFENGLAAEAIENLIGQDDGTELILVR